MQQLSYLQGELRPFELCPATPLYIQLKQILNRKRALNLFRPEFTIVIFIHYKPRIAAAILDL